MTFDLRAAIPENPDESQMHEGGGNAGNNCVVASAAYIMKCLGYADYAPQNWTNDEYGSGYRGYTSVQAMTAEVARHFATPPGTEITNPADNLAYVDAAGLQGQPCEVIFNSDASGNIIGTRGSFHACIPVAFDGSYVWVWKTEKGRYDRLTTGQYAYATAGSNAGTTVRFLKSLGSLQPQEVDWLTTAEAQARMASLESAIAQLTWGVAQGGRIDQASYNGLMGEIGAKGSGVAVDETLNDPRSVQYLDTLGGIVRAKIAADNAPKAAG